MNKNIIISADYACDLPERLLEEYSISVLPFFVTINNIRFQEQTEVDSKMISEYFENDNEKVSSTPAAAEEYRDYFKKLTENKNVTIIHITVSNKLSPAYVNATEAAKDFENVRVIDSGLISCGIGLLAIKGAELLKEGADADTICSRLLEEREKISCSFVLKNTNHAAKNNRVNPTFSHLISLFKIKPMIITKRGRFVINGLCFGNFESYAKKYIRKALANEKKNSDSILFISISGCSDEFKELIFKEATKHVKWKNVHVQEICATNYCNVGPDSFGLMFVRSAQ